MAPSRAATLPVVRESVVTPRQRMPIYALGFDWGQMFFGCGIEPEDAAGQDWELIGFVELQAGGVELEELDGYPFHVVNTDGGYRTAHDLMCSDVGGAMVWNCWAGARKALAAEILDSPTPSRE